MKKNKNNNIKQRESKHFIEEVHASIESMELKFIHNDIPIDIKCKIVEQGLTVRDFCTKFTHKAPPFCRLFFIKRGNVKILTSPKGLTKQFTVEHYLQQGKAYFIPEKLPFNITYFPPEELFHFHIYVTDSLGKSILGDFQEVQEIKIPSILTRFEDDLRLKNRLRLWGSVLDCINYLIRDKLDVLAVEAEKNRKFSLLFQHLHENPIASVSITDLADLYSINASTLSKRFKKNIGISLKHYLTDLMLTNAQDLLLHSNKTISEIALELGFSDSQYFHRFFKKQCLITPRQYRNKSH